MSDLPAEVTLIPSNSTELKVQMKAPYFDEPDELVFPPIEPELIDKSLAPGDRQGFEPFKYAESN